MMRLDFQDYNIDSQMIFLQYNDYNPYYMSELSSLTDATKHMEVAYPPIVGLPGVLHAGSPLPLGVVHVNNTEGNTVCGTDLHVMKCGISKCPRPT